MPKTIPVITFDGPSGTGKGGLAKKVASVLGWHFLDSGVVYRAFAYLALQAGLKPDQSLDCKKLADNLNLEFDEARTPVGVSLNGSDISDELRTEACAAEASKFSALPAVRAELLPIQRAFRVNPGLVTDGRDMGTVVFPDAHLKFFLTASPEERAKRRLLQLNQGAGRAKLPEIEEAISLRDKRDTQRIASPLMPSADAIQIDTTHMTLEEVFSAIMQHIGSSKID